MSIGKRALLALFVVLVAACGEGDDVRWSARFDGGESTGSSTGGATIEANGTLAVRPDAAWVLDAPAPFAGEIGATDLTAIGHALLLTDPDDRVLDAVATPRGPVALVADPAGERHLSLLAPEGARRAVVPPEAERLLFAGDVPLRVEILLSDGQSVLATLL